MPTCASSSRSRMNTCRSFASTSAKRAVACTVIESLSFRYGCVRGLPDQVLSTVDGDHLPGDGRCGEQITHGVAHVLGIGAAAQEGRFPLAAEMRLALARVDDGWTRRHRIDADAWRERVRKRGVEPDMARVA